MIFPALDMGLTAPLPCVSLAPDGNPARYRLIQAVHRSVMFSGKQQYTHGLSVISEFRTLPIYLPGLYFIPDFSLFPEEERI
jgi:hypothetical protein